MQSPFLTQSRCEIYRTSTSYALRKMLGNSETKLEYDRMFVIPVKHDKKFNQRVQKLCLLVSSIINGEVLLRICCMIVFNDHR